MYDYTTKAMTNTEHFNCLLTAHLVRVFTIYKLSKIRTRFAVRIEKCSGRYLLGKGRLST
jgi:hypothetical protein